MINQIRQGLFVTSHVLSYHFPTCLLTYLSSLSIFFFNVIISNTYCCSHIYYDFISISMRKNNSLKKYHIHDNLAQLLFPIQTSQMSSQLIYHLSNSTESINKFAYYPLSNRQVMIGGLAHSWILLIQGQRIDTICCNNITHFSLSMLQSNSTLVSHIMRTLITSR